MVVSVCSTEEYIVSVNVASSANERWVQEYISRNCGSSFDAEEDG